MKYAWIANHRDEYTVSKRRLKALCSRRRVVGRISGSVRIEMMCMKNVIVRRRPSC